ncbi:MAG: hypothetical protein HDR21_12745 [Lachnospiraceae bacterium]|nr:hypothetical protein [Lachnospiraceae bacterium]
MKCSFKYQKQKVLFFWGLREQYEFEKNVVVIEEPKAEKLKSKLQDIFVSFTAKYEKIIIIKVPEKHEYKLPNLVIVSEEDVGNMDTFLADVEKYQEVWICLKRKNEASVAGRFSIDWRTGIEKQVIELVEGNYPRNLEFVKQSENSFCVWTRCNWNTRYLEMEDSQICDDVTKQCVLRSIERKREQFEEFCACAETSGICSVSFDFIFSNGKFVIIDWDTENDFLLVERFGRV